MSSSSHLLVVHTRPVPGREDDFTAWYDEIHLDEVLAVPGFVAVQRFSAADGRFTAVFRIETSDITATLARFESARPQMSRTSALDESSVRIELLTAVGPARGRLM